MLFCFSYTYGQELSDVLDKKMMMNIWFNQANLDRIIDDDGTIAGREEYPDIIKILKIVHFLRVICIGIASDLTSINPRYAPDIGK